MFKSVILLTGSGELALLSARLLRCRPDLIIIAAMTIAELRALGSETLAQSRLIAFSTPVVVPGDVLAQLGYGGYNFHPGPPDYPGLSPAQFALYEGANSFGATAHHMVERVDAGPIVAVGRFEVAGGTSLEALEMGAYEQLARLFWDLSPALATEEAPLPVLPIAWGRGRSTRRSTEAMCTIAPDIGAAELHRRIAAFGHSPLGLRPTVTLHGYRFRLEAETSAEDTTPPLRTENIAAPSAA
jgi:methionyl-tRNA formyltransferase